MNEEVFGALHDALAHGETVALVTIVRSQGSTPQRVGAKMVVYPDGRMVGTIGGGCYENDAAGKAREAIRSGRAHVLRYDLADDLAAESGLICGGSMEVFVEPVQPAPHLYVLGAGHVGYHLARMASLVGFRLHVIDDREKFANAERFPDATEVVVESIAEWAHRVALPTTSYVVIVTRGHRYDLDALRAMAPRELRYLGLIGSRAKIARLYQALQSESIPAEHLARLHAPIGLDIGAVTPEEIAVSIVAELIAVRRGTAQVREDGGSRLAARSMRWAPAAKDLG